MKKRVQALERLLPISILNMQRVPAVEWNDRELYHCLLGSNHPTQYGEPMPEDIDEALEAHYGLPPGELRRRDEIRQWEIGKVLNKFIPRK